MPDIQSALKAAMTSMNSTPGAQPGSNSSTRFRIAPRKDTQLPQSTKSQQQTQPQVQRQDSAQQPISPPRYTRRDQPHVEERPACIRIEIGATTIEIPVSSSETGKGSQAIDKALMLMDVTARKERALLFQAWMTGVFALIGSGLMVVAALHGARNPQFRE